MKMYSIELFSLVFLREKFENTLEISENSGNLVSQKCGHPVSQIVIIACWYSTGICLNYIL